MSTACCRNPLWFPDRCWYYCCLRPHMSLKARRKALASPTGAENSPMRKNVGVHPKLKATKTQTRSQEIHLPPPLKPPSGQFHYANNVEFRPGSIARGMMDVSEIHTRGFFASLLSRSVHSVSPNHHCKSKFVSMLCFGFIVIAHSYHSLAGRC